MIETFLLQLTVWVLPLLFAVIIHEMAHAYVALKLGDPSPLLAGRLSFNPLRHIDLVGSIIMPLILLLLRSSVLFGWAKPVFINYRNFKNPKKALGFVSSAGILANLLTAIICGILISLFYNKGDSFFYSWIMANLINLKNISIVLALFNLLPILPLDGGRLLVAFLPMKYAVKYQATEKYSLYIMLLVFLILPIVHIDLIGPILNSFYRVIHFIIPVL